MSKRIPFSIHFKEEVYEQLRAEAYTTRSKMSKIIHEALYAHFDKQLKKKATSTDKTGITKRRRRGKKVDISIMKKALKS